MTKQEKVIKGLECCLPAHDPDCDLCPYDDIDLRCRAKLRDDIITLLKAQEQKPISTSGLIRWLACENCQAPISPEDKFCHECGQAVKWE